MGVFKLAHQEGERDRRAEHARPLQRLLANQGARKQALFLHRSCIEDRSKDRRAPCPQKGRAQLAAARAAQDAGIRLVIENQDGMPSFDLLARQCRKLSKNRTVAVVAPPSNADDAQLHELGITCARAFDGLVIYESPHSTRPLGEAARLIIQSTRQLDALHHQHYCKLDELRAFRFGLSLCSVGDAMLYVSDSAQSFALNSKIKASTRGQEQRRMILDRRAMPSAAPASSWHSLVA